MSAEAPAGDPRPLELHAVFVVLLVAVALLLALGPVAALTYRAPSIGPLSGASAQALRSTFAFQRDMAWVFGANVPSAALLALAAVALDASTHDHTTSRPGRAAAALALLALLTAIGALAAIGIVLTHRDVGPVNTVLPWSTTLRQLGSPAATLVLSAGLAWWVGGRHPVGAGHHAAPGTPP